MSDDDDRESDDRESDAPAESAPAPRKKKRKKRSAPAPVVHAGGVDVSVRAVRLSRWYGKVTAVSDVSLEVGPGIWGLLGPNGSGKTTFMRMVAGQIKPSSGKLLVLGEAPFANPRVLARIGLCPQEDSLYDELTGLEFVTSMAELSGFDPATAARRAKAALEEFGLEDAMNRRMGGYSRGMRQRAKLAQTVVHDPQVLLLDEPLTGTDPSSRHQILEALKRRAEGGALVLFSTHVLPEIEALTDRLLLIARGQVVAQGEMHEIRQLLDEHPHHIRVRCEGARTLASRLLTNEKGIFSLTFLDDHTLEVQTKEPDATYDAIGRQLLEAKLTLRSITSPDASLEALFHYLVERANRGAGMGADAGSGRGPALVNQAEAAAYAAQTSR
ncbi:MAG: ABC transporter ATP-binding protein [Sandaracinaceae bacterium]